MLITHRVPLFALCRANRIAALLLISGLLALASASSVRAGGQGTTLPPPPLPVRATELRVQLQARMVCVAAPNIVCVAPYLDAGSDSTTTDGGVFRSNSCPGSNPPGACRPDFIPGVELTGELVDTWDVVLDAIDGGTFVSCNPAIQTCILSTPPVGCPLPSPGTPIEIDCHPPSIGGTDNTLICHGGQLELNVTAPGVVVANPIASLDPLDLPGTDFECGESGDGFFPATFGGELIEQWWVTRHFGATCDVALEYAFSFLPRDEIRAIGQQAFPAELCKPDGLGQCTFHPEPVFVELDGSLTRGCGSLPAATFAIRFAVPNEPLEFESRTIPATPLAVSDVDGDGDFDLVIEQADTLQINDGTNQFSAQASGLGVGTLTAADVADWTGDGDVDLVANSTVGTTMYPGNGSGLFTSLGSLSINAITTSYLVVEDLNGDTRPDAVLERPSSSRVVWNQTLAPVVPGFDKPTVAPQSLADLDGDADLDLAAGNDANPLAIQWAENAGPGSFPVSALVSVPDGLDAFWDPTQPQELIALLGEDVYDGVRCETPANTSDCCVDNGSPGCDDTTCEATVCGLDSYCCDVEWDFSCADKAAVACPNVCETYQLACSVTVGDVAAGDADSDGDADLFVSFDLQQDMSGPGQFYSANSRWIAWVPSLQSDDPITAAGQPLFDLGVEPWRLLGRAPAVSDEFDSQDNGPSEIRLIDFDGDSDSDVVAVGLWYRNDGGTFAGPFALHGAVTRPAEPDVLFVEDVDADGDIDVVTADQMWERSFVPEPGIGAMLGAGIAALIAMHKRRAAQHRR